MYVSTFGQLQTALTDHLVHVSLTKLHWGLSEEDVAIFSAFNSLALFYLVHIIPRSAELAIVAIVSPSLGERRNAKIVLAHWDSPNQ